MYGLPTLSPYRHHRSPCRLLLIALQAVSWSFTGLAVMLTGGRLWIRFTVIRRLSWDDGAHMLGLLLLLAQIAIVSGASPLMYRLLENPDIESAPHRDIRDFIRLNAAAVFVSWCCLYAVKISFMLLYRQIFQVSQVFIRAWWTVLIFIVLTFWVLIAGFITGCGRPSALYNHGKSCMGIPVTPRLTQKKSNVRPRVRYSYKGRM